MIAVPRDGSPEVDEELGAHPRSAVGADGKADGHADRERDREPDDRGDHRAEDRLPVATGDDEVEGCLQRDERRGEVGVSAGPLGEPLPHHQHDDERRQLLEERHGPEPASRGDPAGPVRGPAADGSRPDGGVAKGLDGHGSRSSAVGALLSSSMPYFFIRSTAASMLPLVISSFWKTG